MSFSPSAIIWKSLKAGRLRGSEHRSPVCAMGLRKFPEALAICAFSGALSAEAVVVRHDLELDAYRQLAGAAPFSGVVEVEVDTGLGTRRGSGVVIDDQWVLTAAHVTSGAGSASVRVSAGGSTIDAVELRYADDWAGSPTPSLTQGSDLVLVRLGTATPLAPAVIAPEVMPGSIAFIGGYGRTGNGVLGASGAPELLFAMNGIDRRVATAGGGLLVTDFDDGSSSRNALDAATVRRTYYDLGFDDPALTSSVLDASPGTSLADWGGLPTASSFFSGLADEFLEGTSAPGDSGGPMFVFDAGENQWQLAGLSSWGVNPLLPEGFARTDSRYGDLAFFTDLSAHRSWIAAQVPEPAGLLWLGLLLALGRRQR